MASNFEEQLMRFQCLFPFVPGIVIAVLASTALAIEHTKDSLDTVKKNVSEKKATLIDVREKSEWDKGHLKGAVNLPLSEIESGVDSEELANIAGKDTIIYLHCAAGSRSLSAAKLLVKSGRDVRPLKPGYDALVKAGFEKAAQ
jgi:rhodanese-related sulfurtransferase